jgi:hypothetical protein
MTCVSDPTSMTRRLVEMRRFDVFCRFQTLLGICFGQRLRSESNRRITVLQTVALPLGYGAGRRNLNEHASAFQAIGVGPRPPAMGRAQRGRPSPCWRPAPEARRPAFRFGAGLSGPPAECWRSVAGQASFPDSNYGLSIGPLPAVYSWAVAGARARSSSPRLDPSPPWPGPALPRLDMVRLHRKATSSRPRPKFHRAPRPVALARARAPPRACRLSPD